MAIHRISNKAAVMTRTGKKKYKSKSARTQKRDSWKDWRKKSPSSSLISKTCSMKRTNKDKRRTKYDC